MEQRSSLSVVVIGDAGAGKSTLVGHLGVKINAVPPREAEKMEKDCLAAGVSREKRFSWLLDRSQQVSTLSGRLKYHSEVSVFFPQERAAGKSLMLSRVAADMGGRVVTLLCVPGSSRSVRVASRGISQADVALLVVESNQLELDASLAKTGRATEHLLLALTFGITSLIVAVNKMDSAHTRFASARFEEIKAEVEKAAKKMMFDLKRVTVVPVSALLGDNLTERAAENMPWFKGPTLAQALADVTIPPRVLDKPLRLAVREVYRPGVSAGRVEQGTIRVGQVVTMAPRMITTVVESLQMRGKSVDSASAGDVVGVVLKDVDMCELEHGAVIGDNIDPPRVCAQFVASVRAVNLPSDIRPNYGPQILCGTSAVPGAFVRLMNKVDKKKKEKIETPESLANQETGQVLVVPLRPIVLSSFEETVGFGRFAVRDSSLTVAIGKVTICTFDEKTKRRVLREHVRKPKDKK